MGRVAGAAAKQRRPHSLVERQADLALLYELLEDLPEKHRTALLLFEVKGRGRGRSRGSDARAARP
jgi:DNA-directed RNA polymerase specialized sigma24 family protein